MTEELTDQTAEAPEVEEPTEVEPDEVTEPEEEPDTFPRDYVEKLRKESAGYRERAQRTDDLAHRLHLSLVAATGRLADPDDLPFNAENLDDPEALATAVEDLVARKPHLASRRLSGDVGQGASGAIGSVDLAGILRSRA